MQPEEIQKKIEQLEQRKTELMENVRMLKGRLHYKQYEKRALEPFLEQTKDVKIGHLRREASALEFKIATQAFTPKHEREWLKRLRVVEVDLAKVREIERARKKSYLVDQDIEEAQKRIIKIGEELKTIHEELRKLYDEAHLIAVASTKGVRIGVPADEMVTMEEIGVIVEEKKKKS